MPEGKPVDDDEQLEEYMSDMDNSKILPDNQFQHGAFLLDSEKQEKKGKTIKFSEIVDKDVRLGTIADDFLLSIEQEQAKLLVQLNSMAERDKAFKIVFNVLYYNWRSSYILTGTKGGAERKFQAAIVGYRPVGEMKGYGEGYAPQPQQEEEQPKENFLAKLNPFRKKNNQQ